MKEERLVIKKRTGDEEYKNFSIRIKSGTVKKLDDLSQSSNISRNELINILLDYAISHCDIE